MTKLVEYLDEAERSPFGDWFDRLDPVAAARVSVALMRMELGNFGKSKGVGSGVLETKLDFGPGYRGRQAAMGGLQAAQGDMMVWRD